jgi:hypothetical protein
MRGFAFNPNPDSITVSSQTFSDALTDSITDSITVSSQTFSDALTESFTVSSQTFTNTLTKSLSGSVSGSVSGLFRRLAAVWRKRVERTDMLSKRKFL